MTIRERWLAAITMRPVDRLPFWPKTGAPYLKAQSEPFASMSPVQFHQWVGSDEHAGVASCIKETRRRTSVESATHNDLLTTTFTAPAGSARLVSRFDPISQSYHPTIFPAQSLEDIKVLTECFNDCTVELDNDALENARETVRQKGDAAVFATSIGISPLMDWVQHLAGIQNAHLLLADHPQEVEALFDAMHHLLCRKAELICETTPADVVYMVENTSTTLISFEQHRRYCCHHLLQYARIAAAAGRPMVLHMCGKLKKLLPSLAALPVAAFEAFTSPTVGDTTLLDGRTACPDKCLIGGTNAALWIQPTEAIVEQIEADLDALPHQRGIVVTSAGVMPPACKPETIREVCDHVKAYPVRL